MKNYLVITVICSLFYTQLSIAQQKNNDIIIAGHVVDENHEHIPFATVLIKGSTIGTTTDAGGHFHISGLEEGAWVVQARSLGYKSAEMQVVLKDGDTKEVNFTLSEDVLHLDEVNITADRNETNRTGSSVVVNTITPKLFSKIQSSVLSEGLNYTPGLRTENNCSNCGFTQVRMNGMEGPYSQILINNRPIFSGLAGVYGLELIPANMIERVEVVRGGGSALYGSNAIAGTINLILKDPINNSWEAGITSGLTGVGLENADDPAADHTVSFNSSLVTKDNKTGAAIYGFYRNREPFDANNDSFSELTKLKNTTIGSRIFHRFGVRSKITADFFNIKEERRGGNKFDYLPHMSDITEGVEHNITTGALSFEQHFRKGDVWSVYASGQSVARDSYYGAEQSLDTYGYTEDFSYVTGTQYKANVGISSFVLGLEHKGAWLKDTKLGYPLLDSTGNTTYVDNVLIADQNSTTSGIFGQYEVNTGKWQFVLGARYDSYLIQDKASENEDKSGKVFSPRITLKYDLLEYLQARVSYSQGYRAPQIFDEDLHIESSGARRIVHVNAPDLKQESSHSFMASIDFNRQIGNTYIGLLVESFYTRLNDAFANKYGQPDEDGTVVYTRINSKDGAVVKGINMELNLIPSGNLSFKGGFTLQSSNYETAREFDETRFFRTPVDYGYLLMDWQTDKAIGFSASMNYTGKMLLPYFGPEIADPEEGELRESGRFLDAGVKVRYEIDMNEAKLQLFAGVKNIFNSYQSDLDVGIDRDPGYFYGPSTPRTIYVGLKLGNMLK